MRDGSWVCRFCETENPPETIRCGTCEKVIEPDELTGATHLQHLIASLANGGLWRVASGGLGYVVVAARSREFAEEKGAQILGPDAQADQTVTVIEVARHGWLVYVRSALTPYPSAEKPWQAERTRRSASLLARVRKRSAPARPTRQPVEGRVYLGQLLSWHSERRYGTIACADRTIGSVTVRESGVRPRDLASMRAGKHVTFTIEKAPDGPVATNVRLIEPPG
jgi:cold shock CspA family protein